MTLTIGNIYEMMYDKHGLTLYINEIFAKHFANRTEIPIQYMDYEITDIGSDEDGLVIHVYVPYVEYEELDMRAKVNAINQYVNIIHAHDDFADVINMRELEDCVYSFWEDSDYALDKFGNWYDGTGTMVRR